MLRKRRGANRHRRKSAPRSSRPRILSRRSHDPRPRPPPRNSKPACEAARPVGHFISRRHRTNRQRQHGERYPHRLRATRPRPQRLRPTSIRRRWRACTHATSPTCSTSTLSHPRTQRSPLCARHVARRCLKGLLAHPTQSDGRMIEEQLHLQFKPLVDRAFSDMRSEGFIEDDIVIERALEPALQRSVPSKSPPPFTTSYEAEFHRRHEQLYGYSNPMRPTESFTCE